MPYPFKQINRIQSHKRESLLLGSSLILSLGCSQLTFVSGTFTNSRRADKASRFNSDTENPPLGGSGASTGEKLSSLGFAKLASMSMLDFFDKAVEQASNDPILIMGYELDNLKDYLTDHEGTYKSIANRYATLADFFNEIGVASKSDLEPEKVSNGYRVLGVTLNGNESITRSDRKVTDDSMFYAINSGNAQFSLIADDETNTAMAAAAPGSFASDAAARELGSKKKDPPEVTCGNGVWTGHGAECNG